MTDLNEVAANLYAEVRMNTDNPKDGAHACLMCIYLIWLESNSDNDFNGFANDTIADLRELHLMNDVKGEA